MLRPTLQVILSSTRPGRVGKPVTDWFLEQADKHAGFEVVLIDLAEIDLPIFNEPNHPLHADYVHSHTKEWSALVARGDAYVFVTPEYNHSINAALKNALDYLNAEWANKPAGIVSYGGVSAGTRAAQVLKQVLSALKMLLANDAVHIPFVTQFIGTDGAFYGSQLLGDAASVMLDELQRLTLVVSGHARTTTA